MGEARRWQDATDQQEAVIVRLYERPAAAAGPEGLSSDLRLSEFVARYYRPVHLVARDAQPRQVEAVEESVRYWVRFTGDPPLARIGVWETANFLAGLKALPGRKSARLANNTIRKHCGAIQAILDLCGPADREHRDALDLLGRVPYLARPPRDEPTAEERFTFSELARLLDHCDLASLPRRIGGRPIDPATYHRRLLTVAYNTGMRIGGLMGAAWRHLHLDTDDGDRLWLPPRIAAKGRSGKWIELNAHTRAVIESMRGCDAERIFPWPRSWPASKGTLYRQLARITECLPVRRRFGYHAVRRLHSNQLAAVNALACQKSLGHTSGRTTVEHYTSRTIVAEAVAQLPALPRSHERQRRLFD